GLRRDTHTPAATYGRRCLSKKKECKRKEELLMPSPFPGMDPYLETPDLWPDVHHGLISQIQADLNATIRPAYVARVELRVYLSEEDDPGRETIIPAG